MTDTNKRGDFRGMNFRPRLAPCKKCGEMYWKTAARRQYCDACRLVREEERVEENRIRMRACYIRKRDGILPESKLPKVQEPEKGFTPHECLVWKECEFGCENKPGCNFCTATGELRTKGGRSQIIDGRCNRYRPKKKRKEPGWQEIRERRQKQ